MQATWYRLAWSSVHEYRTLYSTLEIPYVMGEVIIRYSTSSIIMDYLYIDKKQPLADHPALSLFELII